MLWEEDSRPEPYITRIMFSVLPCRLDYPVCIYWQSVINNSHVHHGNIVRFFYYSNDVLPALVLDWFFLIITRLWYLLAVSIVGWGCFVYHLFAAAHQNIKQVVFPIYLCYHMSNLILCLFNIFFLLRLDETFKSRVEMMCCGKLLIGSLFLLHMEKIWTLYNNIIFCRFNNIDNR